MPLSPPPGPGRVRFVLLASGILLVGLAGFAGYVIYPRFDLPAATGIGLLLLAAGAGFASFFSPCSFPLLLTLLSREAGEASGRRPLIRRVLVFAGAFSLGAIAFLSLLAVFFGVGGRALAASLTFTSTTGIVVRITVGLVLVLLGAVQSEMLGYSFHGVERFTRPLLERQASSRRRHPVGGFAAFGFNYLLIAFG